MIIELVCVSRWPVDRQLAAYGEKCSLGRRRIFRCNTASGHYASLEAGQSSSVLPSSINTSKIKTEINSESVLKCSDGDCSSFEMKLR